MKNFEQFTALSATELADINGGGPFDGMWTGVNNLFTGMGNTFTGLGGVTTGAGNALTLTGAGTGSALNSAGLSLLQLSAGGSGGLNTLIGNLGGIALPI